MQEFDLIIVGAGSGNMIPGPDYEHWKIAMVEADAFGGTCLNRGCIPSKMLIHSAEVAETIHTSATFGVHGKIERLDWQRITGRVWQRIDPLAEAGEDYRTSLPNFTVYKGEGRFVDTKVLEVNGERITAPRMVIAAGSRPRILDLAGLDNTEYHTSDTVMRLPTQPRSMAIIGGGYIAAELGHFFGTLGTQITIMNRSSRLLMAEDDDISQRFTDIYARKYQVYLQATPRRVQKQSDGDGITLHLEVNGQPETVEAETLLVATGRIPNTDRLDLEQTGVQVDSGGQIVTNAYCETSVPGIWALGDIMSPYPLKHIANLEARTIAYNLVHPDDQQAVNYEATPHAVFTSPQIASAGLTERQAKAQGLPYVVGVKAYSATAYGWAIEDTESFVKILGNQETRKIVGAHIIGPYAALLMQPLVNAMRFGETIEQLARETIYVHPALTEVVENALLEMM